MTAPSTRRAARKRRAKNALGAIFTAAAWTTAAATLGTVLATECTVANAAPRKRSAPPAKTAPAPSAPSASPSPSAVPAEETPAATKPAASAEKPAPAKKAAASPEPTPSAEGSSAASDEGYGHHMQAHLRAEAILGYAMMLRYDKSPRCGPYKQAPASDQQKFCGFGMPPTIDVALGFSVVDFFEPFVFARFGLGDEADTTNASKALAFGLGARLYTISDSPLKIYFTPWLGIDVTGGPVNPNDAGDRALGINSSNYRTDLLVHLDGGPQLDFSRNVGVYLSAGLTMGVLRYLSANAELGLGLQLRAP